MIAQRLQQEVNKQKGDCILEDESKLLKQRGKQSVKYTHLTESRNIFHLKNKGWGVVTCDE